MKNKNTLKYIFKKTKRFLPAVVFRSLLSASSSLLLFSFSILSGAILDIATGAREGNITTYTILLFSAIALHLICFGGGSHMSTLINEKINNHFKKELFVSYSSKKLPKESPLHSGDVLNRFTDDINTVTAGVTNILPSLVSFISKIVAGFTTLFILSPTLSLIFVGAGLLFASAGRLISSRYKNLHKETLRTSGVVRSFLQESFANMMVVKTFSAASPFEERLDNLQKNHYGFIARRSILHIFTSLGLYGVFTIGYYIALVWGAGQLAFGVMTFGTLTATLQIMNQLRQPLRGITGIIPTYLSMIASAERILEIESAEDEEKPLTAEELQALKENFKTLDIKDLSFSYSDAKIFDGASFSINRGDIVALTGRSGIGKTTLFKLLLSLLEKDSGTIRFNDSIEITAAHRGMFAFVPQGNMILSGTIRENIAFANTVADIESIKAAARDAGILDYIESLPNGFETTLSERGVGLSEGQIQRIAIARALLTDAPILLLDECSSSLDEQTERELLETISRLKDKTVLFITHREKVLSVCNKQIKLGE